jgi:hypothetical protein
VFADKFATESQKVQRSAGIEGTLVSKLKLMELNNNVWNKSRGQLQERCRLFVLIALYFVVIVQYWIVQLSID